jgi:hypothetical protein
VRRRVVIESIAEQFKQRAYIVNVTGKNGTVYTLGWDLAGSLKAAYTAGKLVVRTIQSENSDAMITDDGEIVPFVDMKIKIRQGNWWGRRGRQTGERRTRFPAKNRRNVAPDGPVRDFAGGGVIIPGHRVERNPLHGHNPK